MLRVSLPARKGEVPVAKAGDGAAAADTVAGDAAEVVEVVRAVDEHVQQVTSCCLLFIPYYD